MSNTTRRKELREQYERAPSEAGVYRIVNGGNKALLGSTTNLSGIRNKLAFAKSTNTSGVLDRRLHKDVAEYGIDAFSFEVLETLDATAEMTMAEIQQDLDTLEALWLEKMDPAELY